MKSGNSYVIADAATRHALARLHESRLRVADWAEAMAERRIAQQQGFQPRSATLRTLLSIGQLPFAKMRLPWVKWGISAFMMLRSMKRR